MRAMLALRLTPALLAALVLAAHFLRRGQFLPFVLCLAAAVLVFVRRPWVPRALQAFLALGAVLWLVTLAGMVRERMHSGEPWVRLVAILGGVAAFTLVAAAVVGTQVVRRHYVGTPSPASDGH